MEAKDSALCAVVMSSSPVDALGLPVRVVAMLDMLPCKPSEP